MPTYEITNPDTGQTLTVTGDTPPTQEDAAAIFANIFADSLSFKATDNSV